MLKNLFRDYLISTGVADDHIIDLALDLTNDIRYRNPLELAKYVRAKAEDKSEQFYPFVNEIRVHPLSFAEYYSAVGGDRADAFDDYAFYGGMPLILSRPTEAVKMNYLQTLVSEVYLKDIVERKKIKRKYGQAEIVEGNIRLNTVQQSIYVDGQKKEVTEKEFELLKLLIENKNVTMKKEYLFNTVWGSDSDSEIQTLTVHIKWLRKK